MIFVKTFTFLIIVESNYQCRSIGYQLMTTNVVRNRVEYIFAKDEPFEEGEEEQIRNLLIHEHRQKRKNVPISIQNRQNSIDIDVHMIIFRKN